MKPLNCLVITMTITLSGCAQRQNTAQPQVSTIRSTSPQPYTPTKSPDCSAASGGCRPIQINVGFGGNGLDLNGKQIWLANTGAPVNWSVNVSENADRPIVVFPKSKDFALQKEATREGSVTYRVKFTPKRTVDAADAFFIVRDVKQCLFITNDTSKCNEGSGSTDDRYDTSSSIAYRIEQSSSQPNIGLNIFSCAVKTIGVIAGGDAEKITTPLSGALGACK